MTQYILKKLTLRRSWNAIKVLSSFQLSRLLKRPVVLGLPISLSIEPTTSCNLRCPECPSGKRIFSRPTGMLDPLLFRQIINQVYRKTTYLTFYFQGEPFLHPAFTEMVSYAAGKNMFVSTSTNAHYLSKEVSEKVVAAKLHRLIISFDGITPETYKIYRVGGDLGKVKEGISNIIDAKRNSGSIYPIIELQFIIFKHNEAQLEHVRAFAEEMKVDRLVFKTAQVYDASDPSGLVPDNPAFSRYRKSPSGELEIVNEMNDSCWRMWSSCVVTWDGGVVPCCFDKDASNRMGELHSVKFADIWKSDPYNKFRRALFSNRASIEICKNCSEGSRVFATVDQ